MVATKKAIAKVLVLCVSDEGGREVWTGLWEDANLDSYVHVPGEDCECPEDECDCGYFGDYMLSIYELTPRAYKGLQDFNGGHSSHYLSEHGEELCLGDFV